MRAANCNATVSGVVGILKLAPSLFVIDSVVPIDLIVLGCL